MSAYMQVMDVSFMHREKAKKSEWILCPPDITGSGISARDHTYRVHDALFCVDIFLFITILPIWKPKKQGTGGGQFSWLRPAETTLSAYELYPQ